MSTITSYQCPKCSNPSSVMNPLMETYEPTEEDKKNRNIPEYVQDEVMQCPCGEKLTWYSMNQVILEN